MKLNPQTNLIIGIICFGFLIYWLTSFDVKVLIHPYMKLMTFIFFGIGGYNIGLGIGKILNDN